MGAENWFKHDIDSRLVPEMATFLREAGFFGYGIFWAIVEEMHRTNKNEQNLTKLNKISACCVCSNEQFLEVVKLAAKAGLWQLEGDVVISARAGRELKEKEEKAQRISEVRRLAGKRSAEARRTSSLHNEGTKGTNGNKTHREEKRRVSNNNKRPPAFPPSLDNFVGKAAWEKWLTHKKTKGQSYKSVESQEGMLAEWKNRSSSEFAAAIQYSINRNYSGIFEDPRLKQSPPNAPKPTKKPTAFKIKRVQRKDGSWVVSKEPIDGQKDVIEVIPYTPIPQELEKTISSIKGMP